MGLYKIHQKGILGILLALWMFSAPMSLFSDALENQFTEIYKRGIWGLNASGEGTSGTGSLMATTETYRLFLEEFFRNQNIRSVVDAGCGDWEFSQAINWEGIEYRGFDIVKPVIEKNQSQFSQTNVHFFHANFIETELPTADLLICKDVLQHLSNEQVSAFIRQFSKYKYCLITNDVDWNTGTSGNSQPATGLYAYRYLDLTQPPFCVAAYRVLSYTVAGTLKLVLLIINQV